MKKVVKHWYLELDIPSVTTCTFTLFYFQICV